MTKVHIEKPELPGSFGFFQRFFDGVNDNLRGIGIIFRILDIFQGLVFINLLCNIFDGRLDQREHGCYRLIQVGETDGVDMGLIYRHFNFKGSVIQRDGGGIDSGHVLFFIASGLFILRKEHEQQQYDQQDCQRGEYRCVNNLLHMQYDDFCSGTHKRPPVLGMILVFYNV